MSFILTYLNLNYNIMKGDINMFGYNCGCGGGEWLWIIIIIFIIFFLCNNRNSWQDQEEIAAKT